jgi:hypothetical protein
LAETFPYKVFFLIFGILHDFAEQQNIEILFKKSCHFSEKKNLKNQEEAQDF